MTSAKKAAANRINGRKGRGPRTSAGKARASRNARRHGLAAFSLNKDPAIAEAIKPMVAALCNGDEDPRLRQQAIVIAECQLLLSYVGAQKVALINRLRDLTAHPLESKIRLARAKARAHLLDLAAPQLHKIDDLIRQTTAAGRDPEHEPIPPDLEAAWPPPSPSKATERDEHEALCETLRDLTRLIRYENRAWSRRKPAVRAFMAIKLSLEPA